MVGCQTIVFSMTRCSDYRKKYAGISHWNEREEKNIYFVAEVDDGNVTGIKFLLQGRLPDGVQLSHLHPRR